jgi:diguanylate cyclase (GGDEF)-like protein
MSSNTPPKSPMSGDDALAVLVRENAKLQQRIAELERLAAIDTLTPLYNRRHFMEELDRWCWRAHRYGGSYGLLFCDIDRFKAVNDIQGHAIGDQALCGVARALVQAVRKSDVVARIGGDEFTLLLDNLSSDQLSQKTASMRHLLHQLEIATSGPTLRIDISVGSAPIGRDSRAVDVLEQADQAMYAHKRSKYPS